MAGYSGTPLAKKLGFGPGLRIAVCNAPDDYEDLLAIRDVRIRRRVTKHLDVIHFFTQSRRELERRLPDFAGRIRSNGAIWVSWPKRSSKMATDVTEDTVRAVALPLGLVDVKVCAVDDTWSGLKLVIRKALRHGE